MAQILSESFEDTLRKTENKLFKQRAAGEFKGAESSEGRLQDERNVSKVSIQTPKGSPYNVMFDITYCEPGLQESDVLSKWSRQVDIFPWGGFPKRNSGTNGIVAECFTTVWD